jgi:hypothetical protein
MSALTLALIQPPIASADIKATASPSTLSVSTGTMAIFAGDSYTATNPFGTFNTPVINGRAKVFFIKNTGSFGVTRFTLTLSLPSNTNIANFRRCNINVYFTANDVCGSGSYSSLTINENVATTIILNLPPNSYYAFQIRQNKNTTMTVSVSVSSTNINTSGVTNS